MASTYAPPVQDLIDELGRLPGIGPKSAQRIAFHLLKLPTEDAARLARAITEAKAKVRFCERCFNVSEGDRVRHLHRRPPRHRRRCAWSRSRATSSPSRRPASSGAATTCCSAPSAPSRASVPISSGSRSCWPASSREGIEEVILCTNPNIEGEATAMYLARLLKPLGLTVTRIASGLPVGGDLEYADELTLGRALEGRRELDAERRRSRRHEPDAQRAGTATLAGPRTALGYRPSSVVAGGQADLDDRYPRPASVRSRRGGDDWTVVALTLQRVSNQ